MLALSFLQYSVLLSFRRDLKPFFRLQNFSFMTEEWYTPPLGCLFPSLHCRFLSNSLSLEQPSNRRLPPDPKSYTSFPMPALRERTWEAEGNHRNVTSKLLLSYLAFTGWGGSVSLSRPLYCFLYKKTSNFSRLSSANQGTSSIS